MATVAQLEAALRKADAAGDVDGATLLARALKDAQSRVTPGEAAVDALRSVPGGIGKGTAGLVGSPGDVRELATGAGEWLAGQFGIDPTPARSVANAFRSVGGPTSADVNQVISAPTGGYYKPQTEAGQYAETIASFAPGMAFPGSLATRTLGYVGIPGALSETAGQATAGTPYEPYARAGAALAGGGVLPAIRSISRLTQVGAAHAGVPINSTRHAERILAESARGRRAQVGARAAEFEAADVPYTFFDIAGHQTRRTGRAAAGGLEGEAGDAAMSYANRIMSDTQGMASRQARRLTPETRTVEEVAAEIDETQSILGTQNYGRLGDVRTTDDALSALRGPQGEAAIERAITVADANRDVATVAQLRKLQTALLPENVGRFPPTMAAGAVHLVRRALGNRGANANRSLEDQNPYLAKGLFDRARSLDNVLETDPNMRTANAVHSDFAAQREALDLGQAAAPGVDDVNYAAQLGRLDLRSPNARAVAGIGYARGAERGIRHPAESSTGYLNRLATSSEQKGIQAATYGPERAGQFQKAIKLIIDRVANARMISPATGSQTQGRLSEVASLIDITGSPLNVFARAIDFARRHGKMTPEIRAEVVRLGSTEAEVKRLAALIPSGMTTKAALARSIGQAYASSNSVTGP